MASSGVKPHAMRVERRIRIECARLTKFPELGIKTDMKGVRRFPIVRYPLTIFYRIDGVHAKLEILRIVRSAAIRDLNQPPD